MRILLLFLILFSQNTFSRSFTLTGSSEQQSTVTSIDVLKTNGYSVYCDLTTVATSVDLKIFLGNIAADLTQAANIVLTTTAIHGLEATTYSKNARVVMTPVGGTFTAVCVDNQ